MHRLQRPGNTFCVGALLGAAALHYDVAGWVIVIGAFAIGWALNEDERRSAERNAP